MARSWGVGFGIPVSKDTVFNSVKDIEGASSSDYSGSFVVYAGNLSAVIPAIVKPAGPDTIKLEQKGPVEYFRCIDRGSVAITDGKPATQINPEQSFFVDSVKDCLSVGAGYLGSRLGASGLATALTASGVASAGVGVTVAGAVSSALPPLLFASGAVLASQIALNYVQVALSSPATSSSVNVNSKLVLVRVYPPTYNVPSDYVPPSSSASSSSSGNPTNYDLTSDYFASYPSWNSGQRHQIEGNIISDVSNYFKDAIKKELSNNSLVFSPTQENDFDTSDFWEDFKVKIKGTLEGTTEKRGTDSYKNDLNQMIKDFDKISISLNDIHSDLKYLSNTMYDFSIGLDIDSIMKKYFTVPILNEPILTKNIAKILDDKSFSSDYIVVEGGEY